MTTRTRRLVFVSALLVALMLPAEIILLRAVVVPSQSQAVREWTEGLRQGELAAAAAQIQHYPFQYRREIMRRLAPAERSNVWRAHLRQYLASHPTLPAADVQLIQTASTILSPAAFADPTEARRTALEDVANQIVGSLGREEAEYLLYQLGPKDGAFASFEPLAMKLQNKVRGMFALVAQAYDCNCTMSFGCQGGDTICSNQVSCAPDSDWPACGWGWWQTCDGMCFAGW